MPYSLRDTWPDSTDRRDYVIRCEGLEIGRVYLTQLPEGDRFVWSIYISGHVQQIADVPVNGHAVTLDEAATAFKRSYEAMRTKAGVPRPQR
jgi:hypothetical protein